MRVKNLEFKTQFLSSSPHFINNTFKMLYTILTYLIKEIKCLYIYIERERERENKIKGATEGVKTFINS